MTGFFGVQKTAVFTDLSCWNRILGVEAFTLKSKMNINDHQVLCHIYFQSANFPLPRYPFKAASAEGLQTEDALAAPAQLDRADDHRGLEVFWLFAPFGTYQKKVL